jgi:hypothetical protein
MLEEFDDNITVGQVIKKIKGDQKSTNQEEESSFKRIKKEYEGSYLKVVDDDTFYGRSLSVYFIEEITSKERTTDWDLVYKLKGKKISFTSRDIYEVGMNGTDIHYSFLETELQEMTKIPKEKFEQYAFKYNEIKDKLAKIIE